MGLGTRMPRSSGGVRMLACCSCSCSGSPCWNAAVKQRDSPAGARAMKQATTVLIAAGALLVGVIATAAYMNNRDSSPDVAAVTAPAVEGDTPASEVLLPQEPALEYADIVAVAPVTEKEKRYGTVIATDPVREATSQSVPHERSEEHTSE